LRHGASVERLPRPSNPTVLRYVTEKSPCPEVARPKANNHSAMRNARLAIARATKPIRQRRLFVIGGQLIGVPACSAGTTPLPRWSPCLRAASDTDSTPDLHP
jgi:hypothetical protein